MILRSLLEKESVKLRVASVKTVESFVQKVLRNLSAGQLLQILCYKVCTTTKTYPDLHAVPNLPTTKGKIKIKGAEHVRKSFMPLNTCRTDRHRFVHLQAVTTMLNKYIVQLRF